MEPVGVGRRAVAVLIDSILLFIVAFAIAVVTGNTSDGGFEIQGAPFFVWLVVGLGYFIGMEGATGATLGKRLMNLKVVKEGGAKLDWQAAIVRNVLRVIDGLFFYLVGAIVVWVSKKRQRLGDIAAHTIVVSSKVALLVLAIGLVLVPAEGLAANPRFTDLVLSDAKDGPPKATYAPSTAKIFLKAKLVDVPASAKVRSDWIAVKTKVAPPNYKIDSVELPVGILKNRADFSMGQPKTGWPEGDYRVELSIDGRKAAEATFKVAK